MFCQVIPHYCMAKWWATCSVSELVLYCTAWSDWLLTTCNIHCHSHTTQLHIIKPTCHSFVHAYHDSVVSIYPALSRFTQLIRFFKVTLMIPYHNDPWVPSQATTMAKCGLHVGQLSTGTFVSVVQYVSNHWHVGLGSLSCSPNPTVTVRSLRPDDRHIM